MKDLQKEWRPHIASVATATPPSSFSQEEAGRLLDERYGEQLSPRSRALVRKMFENRSIRKRSFAIASPEGLFEESPDDRISRFTRWSADLSAEAIQKAVSGAGLSLSDITGLVVNTCTGYICPGVSTYLMEMLGLDRSTRVYDLVGSGCGGAIPNLELAEALVRGGREKVIVSVAVEVCTATFQMGDDLSLLISNALFGDGAAAAVLWNRPEGLELIASSSRYVPEEREAIRYVHRNGQLYNQLATNLPHLVKRAAGLVVRDLLEPRGIKVSEIKRWALHTGGEKIINTVSEELGLSEEQLGPTRRVLSEYGNMSSPTVWFVLREALSEGIEKGDYCVMLAYGAGLSAHACLLRKA